MITDNCFTADSIAVHAERLLLMQQNFAANASVFASMNPESLSWAPTCYTNFQSKLVGASHQEAQSKAATTASQLAFKSLRQIYFALKDYARQSLVDNRETYEAFKLNLPYPTKQYAQIGLVSSFFIEHSRRLEASEPGIFPEFLVSQLKTALETADSAFQAKSNARMPANHARLAFIAQRKTDVQNLKLIIAFASAVWKSDDGKYNEIGFVRPDQLSTGKGNTIPKVPTGLRLTGTSTLEWTSMQGATSYYISTSDDGENWLPETTSQTNSIIVRIGTTGKIYYRVRARNAGGFGEYSTTFDKLFGLDAVEDFFYDLGELSWAEVEFASSYDLERAPKGSTSFVRIYSGNTTTASDTPPTGDYIYRVRAVSGNVKSDWVEVEVEK